MKQTSSVFYPHLATHNEWVWDVNPLTTAPASNRGNVFVNNLPASIARKLFKPFTDLGLVLIKKII